MRHPPSYTPLPGPRVLATAIRWVGKGLLVLALLLAVIVIGWVGRVEASDGMRGDKCVVEKNQIITEDFYFFCRILEIHGTIDGDLIGMATEITLAPTATVTGDLWIGGGKLDVNGTVGDDLHFAGITVIVRDGIRFTHNRIDLSTVALNATIEPEAVLPGDLLMYGYQAWVYGILGGDVDFTGEALIIEGVVGGNIAATVGDPRRSNDLPALPFWDVSFRNPGLWLAEDARIGGDLIYEAASASTIPPGVVQGRRVFNRTEIPLDITSVEQPNDAARLLVDYIRKAIYDVVTLMIVGVIMLRFAATLIREPADHVRQRAISAVGWGLVTFMFSIPAAIVVVFIGLILLLVLYLVKLISLMVLVTVGFLVISAGLVGGFYFLLIFLGRIVISFLIGELLHRYVLHLPEWGQMRQWVFTLALGSAVYSLITNVPLPAIGLILELVTALAGGGAVIMTIRDILYASNLFAPAVVDGLESALEGMPPPPDEARIGLPTPPSPPPGLDNLPEGFTGFDEDW